MRFLRSLRDTRATAATEFAVIIPVLAAVALGMIDGWSLYGTSLGMHAAVNAGVKYFIQGGNTAATATSIASAAWTDKPSGGAVTVTEACTCAGAAASCSAACVGALTDVFTISATGTWTAPFNANFLDMSKALTQTQAVRVR